MEEAQILKARTTEKLSEDERLVGVDRQRKRHVKDKKYTKFCYDSDDEYGPGLMCWRMVSNL